LDIDINLVFGVFQQFLGNKDSYENALPPVTAGEDGWSILSLKTY